MSESMSPSAPRRRDDEVVGSAEAVSFVRAASARERDVEAANPDYLAKHFLGWWNRALIEVVPVGLSRILFERKVPGTYGGHIARTRHCDRMLHASLDAGAQQLVILGAGYDTRPYRFRERLTGVPVFEVDLPGTQARKKDCLQKLHGDLPSGIRYVPIDFERQKLADVLLPAGYNPRLRTHFNWEGVTYYIDEPAVSGVLSFVRDHAARGSAIAFDYWLRSFVEGDLSRYGAEKPVKYIVGELKEPFLFGLDTEEVGLFMTARGFEVVSDLGPIELTSAYLTRRDGKLVAPVWGMIRMCYARTP